ncbi:MAG TPA: outer membrane protein transport protein [Leptospiraceae bacterium]|nr:outer membrane protein transport protein [Leptospiraceae bacterium]HMX34444.1 outer membrane protein transport protein [Leptospiraceae bacterium]HMY29852.1 outer membrane protein transport protein [Leptospiraceae bacterium]HMZ63004.1 outer membrane protein transport protein [Leptospiraceae bacterium]HNA07847.1 outer membrane protein transport protein [Leptospiraceae bacterium]
MIIRKRIIILFLFCTVSLYADSYHNINGFFGEKAAGLGGAYTAISDDPSGAYYNPAGLTFAYDNSISLSASNITRTSKTYENVIGPGQGYDRSSQNYIPNFFGIVKEVGGYKVAFSILNTLNETFNRNDQIVNPIYYPSVRSLRSYNIESYNQVQAGFSIAKSITEKLSVGATLYYTHDTANLTNTGLVQFANRNFNGITGSDNRKTTGFMPVLGIMFMPNNTVSLGLSVRHQFVTAGNRLTSGFAYQSNTNADGIYFTEGTHEANGGSIGSRPYFGGKLNGRIPEVTEVRTGIAVFPTKKLMAAFDTIYTSGYQRGMNQNDFYFLGGSANQYTIRDTDVRELRRYATLNFAFGLEYFLTDNFAIRAGLFTNNANSKDISWVRSAIEGANRDLGSDAEVVAQTPNGVINYQIPALRSPTRNEYVNLKGYSLGFSWSTSRASIGLSVVKEVGKGGSQLDETRPSQQMTYDSTAIYVIVSSKNN